VLGIIASVAAPKGNTPATTAGNTSANTPTAQNTSIPAPTTPPAPEAPAYADIAVKKASMTDAQWSAYADTLKGNHITNWQGTVLDVSQRILSDDYNIQVDLDSKGGSLNVAEALVDVPKADALKVEKGQAITFSGTIESVNCIITYCPVQVVNPTYTVK
jgi:hypothetical protein